MKKVYVLRHTKGVYGAFGVMFNDDGIPFAVTLENEETLIPAGIHKCTRDFYYAGGYPTFEIQIKGRDRLLFHKLNWNHQSKGCVGIAESYEILNGIPAISQSGKGFQEFWDTYKNEKEIEIEVKEFYVKEKDAPVVSSSS